MILTFTALALAGVGNSVFTQRIIPLFPRLLRRNGWVVLFLSIPLLGMLVLLSVQFSGFELFIGWRGPIATIGVIGVSMSLCCCYLIRYCRWEPNQEILLCETHCGAFSSRPLLSFFLFYMFSSMAFGMVQFSVLALQPFTVSNMSSLLQH